MSDPLDQNPGEKAGGEKAGGRIEPTLPGAAKDPVAAAAETEELRGKLDAALAQVAAAEDARLRTLAELDNVRKRAEREISASAKYGTERLLGDLLSVCDSLELGLKAAGEAGEAAGSLLEGMQLTHKQLLSVLERYGVKAVDPQGQPFNPEVHEAVSMVESAEVPPNHVLTVMQKGYRLHERSLRPAMVVVARAPAQAG